MDGEEQEHPTAAKQRRARPRAVAKQWRPWREDPVVLARLPVVEQLHLSSETVAAIAVRLGLGETTIRSDLERIRELWVERTSGDIAERRAARIAELDDIKRQALAAARWDLLCERAVLFGMTVEIEGELVQVERDVKGAAQFRGNKAAAFDVARKAVVDAAKLDGLIVERSEVANRSEVVIREYVGFDPNQV